LSVEHCTRILINSVLCVCEIPWKCAIIQLPTIIPYTLVYVEDGSLIIYYETSTKKIN
jgi:hypothetical protein